MVGFHLNLMFEMFEIADESKMPDGDSR